MCIEGYPERNTPTILVYKDGEIRRQLITLRELNGPRTKLEGTFHMKGSVSHLLIIFLFNTDLERMLLDLGAVKESDVRLKKRSDSFDDDRRREEENRAIDNNDDDDWD